MKRVHRRSLAVLVLVALFLAGMGFFLSEYFTKGGQWVGFAANRHLYSGGNMVGAGRILDRDGANTLSYPGDEGRTYNSDETIRRATLHAVGDLGGNIATGALRVFSDKMTGYNLVTGVYGLNGKGNDVYLTIDADVCAAAYRAMDGRKGAVGVYNYETGEILCMVSANGFDPLDPPVITEENEEQYEGVYVNRFLSSTYTPGSIYKLVTSTAAIECIPDIEERTFQCTGSITLDGTTITCPKAHGELTFQQALTVSCNTTFGQIAVEVGAEKIKAYAESACLLDRMNVDGILTAAGRYDDKGLTQGEEAWSGIGQHTDTVNPCSFLYFMGTIAGGGTAAQPRILGHVVSSTGFPLSLELTQRGERAMSATTAATLKQMMRANVLNNYGDGNFPSMEVCAKSGTAEVGEGQTPHAWFAGFCADENYPLAFVVVLENGGSGSGEAAPVAAAALQAAKESMDREAAGN